MARIRGAGRIAAWFPVAIFPHGARSAFRQEGPPLRRVALRQRGRGRLRASGPAALGEKQPEAGARLGRRCTEPGNAGDGGGGLPCRNVRNSHTALLLLPFSPSPVCSRTWRRESAGGCFCERPPPPRCRSPKDRGARPPRGPAV